MNFAPSSPGTPKRWRQLLKRTPAAAMSAIAVQPTSPGAHAACMRRARTSSMDARASAGRVAPERSAARNKSYPRSCWRHGSSNAAGRGIGDEHEPSGLVSTPFSSAGRYPTACCTSVGARTASHPLNAAGAAAVLGAAGALGAAAAAGPSSASAPTAHTSAKIELSCTPTPLVAYVLGHIPRSGDFAEPDPLRRWRRVPPPGDREIPLWGEAPRIAEP